ncbi:MAG: Crp/Fnr family transcriptional regulator [Bacillota bacterium]|nr:Crp/Fnr family transcriptional regulator [Bacillota bacterium]
MTEKDDLTDQLKRVTLFADLPPEALAAVASLTRERPYRKGHIIFLEGEPGEAVFLLRRGRVKLTRRTADGREHTLHLVNPGEVFAEVVIFDGGPYPATAEVIEDAVVGIIANRDLDRLTLEQPSLALAFLKIMARRLRQAQDKVMSLALHDVTRRVITGLLMLAEDYGVPEAGGTRINLDLTNQELGNLVGASRESVNRTLSELRQAGLIELDRQRIVIRNRRELLEML